MIVSVGGVLLAPEALASEPAPVFGKAGQVVLPELMGVRSGVPGQFAGLGLGSMALGPTGTEVGWGGIVGYSQYAWQQNRTYAGFEQQVKAESKSLWVTPSVDVFVGRGISIGLSAGYLHTEQRLTAVAPGQPGQPGQPWEYSGFAVGVSPRIGYVVPIARGLSFWPRLSVSAAYAEQTAEASGAFVNARGRAAAFSGGLDLGLVYQPIQRLMFKVSPQVVVGRTLGETLTMDQYGSSEGMFVRLGGEATVGLVF